MAVCDMCGNDDARSFTITRDDRSGTYDSLECAISDWAPACGHCGCRVLGHAVEVDGTLFCSTHCATTSQRARRPIGARPATLVS